MCNLAVINGAGRITNANRTRSNDTRHVVDDVIMRIVAQLVVAILININSTIAGLASTIQVRSHLIVKHQIPYKHSLAILVYRSERHILHVRHQSFTQVTSVIPGSDTGFRVGNTLSENGTVARGICSKDADENLTTCVERTEIMRIDGKVSYKDEQGEWVAVGDNTPVSMNVWGFTPDYFQHSEEYFKEFLSDPKNMENKKAEFFIPLMVNKLINEGTATVKVLDTTSKWFGVTYAADRQSVVDKIQHLIDEGVYPNKLF